MSVCPCFDVGCLGTLPLGLKQVDAVGPHEVVMYSHYVDLTARMGELSKTCWAQAGVAIAMNMTRSLVNVICI